MKQRVKKVLVIYDNIIDGKHIESVESIGDSDNPIEAMTDARDWLDFSIKSM